MRLAKGVVGKSGPFFILRGQMQLAKKLRLTEMCSGQKYAVGRNVQWAKVCGWQIVWLVEICGWQKFVVARNVQLAYKKHQ